MVYTNGWSPSIVILQKAEGEPVTELTSPYLHVSGYYSSTISTPDEAWSLLREQQPDAIVANDQCQEHVNIFRAIKSSPEAQRPVLVLITDIPQAEHAELADLLIPAAWSQVDDYLHQQLHTFLKLREQNAHLSQQIATLEITLREQKYASDRELSLLKNAIVRNVSHELKTPLLQVKSAVALLAEDVGHTKLIGYATDATTRLEAVIKNITQLAGSLETKLEQVILREIIDYVILDLRRVWQRKADISRIQVNIEPKLPLVLADKNGIGTALQLLIDNALKFSHENVEVSARRMEQCVRVAVRDEGIGIAKDKIEKIFEGFYQVDGSSTRRYGGTGVGLTIVSLILEHHHSQIMVESVEGKGSIFFFELPIAELDSRI
jgi:signal transduction histidine kinase